MNITLTKEMEELVEEKVRSGRYLDASDVMRDALRLLERHDADFYESPELEAALLEGIRGAHRPFDEVMKEIRDSISKPE